VQLLALNIAQLSLSIQRSAMPADLLIIAHIPYLPKKLDGLRTEILIITCPHNSLKPEILIFDCTTGESYFGASRARCLILINLNRKDGMRAGHAARIGGGGKRI
jgi:hypothetical protein